MKIGTISYIPPVGVCNSQSFYDNVSRVKATHPFYLFSDDQRWNPSQLIKWPEFGGRKPPWTINNFLFFKALEIAKVAELEYYLFMESDSRVSGDGFDDRIFQDFFNRYPKGIACAGTPVCWDMAAAGRDFASRVVHEAFRYQTATGIPVSFYSGKNPMDCSGGAYYPNGSLAVYETKAMLAIFGGFDFDIVNYARRLTAFDLALGRALYNFHGSRAVDHVGWLSSCYSAYGNCITTEKERLQFLAEGRFAAVHQVKGTT